jgi:hypothetical protein
MKRALSAFCTMMIILIATSVCSASRPSADGPEYTDAQIEKTIRVAHTNEKYSVLADFYAAGHGNGSGRSDHPTRVTDDAGNKALRCAFATAQVLNAT